MKAHALTLGTDDAEDLVDDGLNLVLGLGLNVEAQQRLGVGSTHVEPCVRALELNSDAIELSTDSILSASSSSTRCVAAFWSSTVELISPEAS